MAQSLYRSLKCFMVACLLMLIMCAGTPLSAVADSSSAIPITTIDAFDTGRSLVSVTLEGDYDAPYAGNSGSRTTVGPVKSRRGKVMFRNIWIK